MLFWIGYYILFMRQDTRSMKLYNSRIFIMVFGSYLLFGIFALINSLLMGNFEIKLMRITGIFILFLVMLSLIWGNIIRNKGYEGGLKYILRPYVYLSLYISITGIIAWILLTFDIIQLENCLYDMNMITEVSTPNKYLFAFPFKLNFAEICIGSKLLSYQLFRMSGLSMEPHQAGLFIAPSLFIIHYLYNTYSLVKLLSSFIIGLFLLLTFSPTVVVILFICAILYGIMRRNHLIILLLIIGVSILLIIFPIVMTHSSLIPFTQTREGSYQQWLNSINEIKNISLFGFFGDGKLEPVFSPVTVGEGFGLGGLILLYIHFIIVVSICLYYLFKRYAIIGLCPIYIILHFHKGVQIDSPFYIYILFTTVVYYVLSFLRYDNNKQ